MKRTLCVILPLLLLISLTACDFFAVKDTSTEPPQMVVITENARIRAQRFSYTWETSAGANVADSVDPRTFAYDPIPVKEGELLQFVFEEGKEASVFTIWFYPEGSEEGITVEYEMNYQGIDPRFAEGSRALFEATENGVYVVEAHWPSWVRDGINGEAAYGFAVSVDAP
jgi:hypothetical protein